jgi:hypothetical protein
MQGLNGGLVSIGVDCGRWGGSGSVSVVGSTLARISAVRRSAYKVGPGGIGGLVYIHQGSSGNISVVDSDLTDISMVRMLCEY